VTKHQRINMLVRRIVRSRAEIARVIERVGMERTIHGQMMNLSSLIGDQTELLLLLEDEPQSVVCRVEDELDAVCPPRGR
jgi:hypothetical protein